MPEQRLAKGMLLGEFVIEEQIGRGGMATVYLANQISLARQVALKVLHPELAVDRDRIDGFVQEARVAAQLNHPGIVQIHSIGEEDGYYYFAMELVLGASVKEILNQDGKPNLDWSLMVVRKVALALRHAWNQAKLVHRDIKPDNILIRQDGAVKLADLGLALPAPQLQGADQDTIEGSPHYISPEALSGKPMDFRSDIYSLGATLYHMAAGSFPYVGDTPVDTARMHLQAQLEPPDQRNPDLPAVVSGLIMRMMAPDPKARSQSLDELVAELETVRVKARHDAGRRVARASRATDGKASEQEAPPAASTSIRSIWILLPVAVCLALVVGLVFAMALRSAHPLRTTAGAGMPPPTKPSEPPTKPSEPPTKPSEPRPKPSEPTPKPSEPTKPSEDARALITAAQAHIAKGRRAANQDTRQKEYAAAAEAYAKALELNPEWRVADADANNPWAVVQARVQRAGLWQAMHQQEKARGELEIALEQTPQTMPDARSYLQMLIGDSFSAQKNWIEAEAAYLAAQKTGLSGDRRKLVPAKLATVKPLAEAQRQAAGNGGKPQ